VIAVLFLPYFAAIYIGIALMQLRKADLSYPGVRRARTALIAFGSVAGLLMFSQLISALATSGSTT
jgi:succinate dehydrogenase/fumarate reductase cytochrome b subunit